MSLKNSRVLVIGGTSGIGLGVATAVAERGAVPIVASRKQSNVDAALARLPELTTARITGFFATRFVGALSAVRVFAPRIAEGGSVTLTSSPPPNSRDSAPCR
jgi:NADP-dependent 3-hydroxy acid dehydrogenase YdfG